jgi:hypothetical protein
MKTIVRSTQPAVLTDDIIDTLKRLDHAAVRIPHWKRNVAELNAFSKMIKRKRKIEMRMRLQSEKTGKRQAGKMIQA